METPEHILEWLLNYDGRRSFFASGHFLKFDIRRVEQSDQVPHGIAYSFTFHDPEGMRLLGFDNAHPVLHKGGAFVKAKPESDHWHRTIDDEGRPYTFVSVEQLLEDFLPRLKSYARNRAYRPGSLMTRRHDDENPIHAKSEKGNDVRCPR